MAKQFADGMYFNYGGFNHRAAECAARKTAQSGKVAGVEVQNVGTGTGSKETAIE
jgi:translation elongation factor P/translation initiation factor 5A